MVARPNRPRPIPEASQPRVNDASLQRAFELLFVPLREVVRFLQPYVQQEKWKALPYLTGWSDDVVTVTTAFRGAYRKDPMARVWLRGCVRRISGATTAIATLPEGYRPTKDTYFGVLSVSSGFATVRVSSLGVITFLSGGSPDVSLDGLSFDTVNE